MGSEQSSTTERSSTGSLLRKLLVVGIVAVVAVVFYRQFGDQLTLQALAQREAQLRVLQQEHPLAVYGIAFLTYAIVAGLSLPLAAPMTLVMGWYFGFVRGVLLVSFASTTGATFAFLLSRYLLRDVVQNRFGERLAGFNEALRREGAFYLFTLRLIPAVPFFVINVVMGLTPIGVWTYWWVSQLGMLSGTSVYVYAGATVPDLQTLAEQGAAGILTPQLLLAFVLLGVFPLLAKKVMQRLGGATAAPVDP